MIGAVGIPSRSWMVDRKFGGNCLAGYNGALPPQMDHDPGVVAWRKTAPDLAPHLGSKIRSVEDVLHPARDAGLSRGVGTSGQFLIQACRVAAGCLGLKPRPGGD